MDTSHKPEDTYNPPPWLSYEQYLMTAEPGPDLDAYIDDITEHAFSIQGELDRLSAIPVLIRALDRAMSPLTRRSVALAIASTADAQGSQAVDALVTAYRLYRDEAFLAPVLLESLGLLALSHPLARAEAIAALLRLTPDDVPYLLIKGIQLIGRLDNQRQAPELRDKLHQLSQNDDFSVAAEAYFQEALITLMDALLAPDIRQLREQLVSARAGFHRAEATSEMRPDARIYIVLIDMVLALEQFTHKSHQTAEQLARFANDLYTELTQTLLQVWSGYRSPRADLIAIRCLHIADVLRRATSTVTAAEDWTNLDDALVNLATILTLSQADQIGLREDQRLYAALKAIIDEILIPKLGPVLKRAVTRRRLERVIENHRATSGDDGVTTKLLALQQALIDSEISPTPDQASGQHIQDFLGGFGPKVSDTIRQILEAIGQDSSNALSQTAQNDFPSLPIDKPQLYGSDPTVDATMRHLLQDVRQHLGSYPTLQWRRFEAVLEKIVSFFQLIRNQLPDYTLCKEDGGKGISASEKDLQNDVFRMLHMEFGRSASFEHTGVGGGRTDAGVGFPEVFFPIEVKHEFTSIERGHVHDTYLAQADLYAAATDRIAFLLILDLRETNCSGHRKQVRTRRRVNQTSKNVSLYRLEQSFWVDGLPTDPQVANATSNAVIVGVVPGNRSRPSSTTTYSKRPRVS